jgi:nicotinamidase-related amidase
MIHMKTALLLIDIQNDYFPGGKMELTGSPEASLQARKLLDYFRQAGLPHYFIRHISTRPGATFFLPGTPGIEIHENIWPQPGEAIIEKHYPNSFRETSLLDILQDQGIERLVISGMMTHMCVDATTRAATDFGFQNLVAGDACATRDLNFEGQVVPATQVQAAFLAALNGSYGKVLNTAQILQQLGEES